MLCFIRIKEVSGLYKEKSRWTTNRSPGEIKRRKVSWTIMKKLDFSGEIKSREVVLHPQDSPEEIKSREVVLDPQDSPGEIKSREVVWTLKTAQERSRAGRCSWAQKTGLLLLQLCLSSSATDIVFVTLFCTAVETATA